MQAYPLPSTPRPSDIDWLRAALEAFADPGSSECFGKAPGSPRASLCQLLCVGLASGRVGKGQDTDGVPDTLRKAPGPLSPPELHLQPCALSSGALVPQYYVYRAPPCHSGPLFSQEGPSVRKQAGLAMAVSFGPFSLSG